MVKRINTQALLEFVCFSAFAALMFYLAKSGRYLSYVTPKMEPYLYFTSAVMLVWAVSKFPGLFRPQHRTRAAHCLVLIIPILLLLLPHSSVGTSGMSSGYLGGDSINGISGKAPSAGSKTEVTAAPDGAKPDSSGTGEADKQNNDSIIKKYGLKLSEDGSINVSDDLFYPWLSEIFANINKYEGTKITIKGFVFKEDSLMKSNEFVMARLLMWCCSADLSPCGIICEYDKTSVLKEDTWVTVIGTIHKGEYQGKDEPKITVTSILPADKPQKEYVYP